MNVVRHDMLKGGEKAVMSRKKRRKVSLIIGLVAGALVDGYLRLISGDEGNLLVRTMVFLGGTLIAAGVGYGLFYLWDVIFLKEKG